MDESDRSLQTVDSRDLKTRTKRFSLRVIRLVKSLPFDDVVRTIGKQLLRSGTSVGANYRAACRARSAAEFCAEMGIVEEECDESIFWMELVVESNTIGQALLGDLMAEANELVANTVASIQTARKKKT